LLSLSACVSAEARRTEAGLPQGVWAGEVEGPLRPLLLTIDFDANTAAVDIPDLGPWTIENASADAASVQFEMRDGDQLLHADGERADGEIRGAIASPEGPFEFWIAPEPTLPAPRNRVDAWRQDLEVLKTRLLRYDRSFSPDGRSAFQERIATLEESLGEASDQEIMVALSRGGERKRAHAPLPHP
jgi:hypothetical protein